MSAATVTDTPPSADLKWVNWACTASAGSSCTASGEDNVADSAVNLLPGGTATYTVTANVICGTPGPIPNSASISSMAYDAYTADNTASVSTAIGALPDLIFENGFESGGLAAWSHFQDDAGPGGVDPDLTVSSAAALNGTGLGMQAVMDDNTGMYVQDDYPCNDSRYRARFFLDPNGFDPGEALAHRRIRILIVFSEPTFRRVAAIVVRRLGGVYSVMGRARLDDNTQADTGFFMITDAPHSIEIDLKRANGPDSLDGSFELLIDGVSMKTLPGLDNSLSKVDYARLGVLSLKLGVSGTLYLDEFESWRQDDTLSAGRAEAEEDIMYARTRGVAIVLLGLVATGLTRDVASGPAAATVGIRNISGVSVEHIYTVPADENEAWSADVLSAPLLSGEARLFPQMTCEELDIRLVDTAGRECRLEGMYLCLNIPCDLPTSHEIEGAEGTWELTATQLGDCVDLGS